MLIKALRAYVSATPQRTEDSNRQHGTTSERGRVGNPWGARFFALIAVVLLAVAGLAFYLFQPRKAAVPIAVPDLQGKMPEQARSALHAEHLVLGSTVQKEDAAARLGSIVAQSVAAGERVPAGTQVDITVAIAPQANPGLADSRTKEGRPQDPPAKSVAKEKPRVEESRTQKVPVESSLDAITR